MAGLPDLQVFRELVRDQLVHLLESVPGQKDLVLEEDLMRPLDRVAGASLLRKHGVDKIFKLNPAQKSLPGCSQRLYIVRPRVETMEYIGENINTEKRQQQEFRHYKILMTPKKLHVCEVVLEQQGVFGSVIIDEFPLDLIPLDRDVLSMELPEFLPTFYLDCDHVWLYTVAKSLVNIQAVYGKISDVHGIGKGSKMVNEIMTSMMENLREPDQRRAEIGKLLLIDRDVDFVTTLCSQLTYEGILDDTFGIHSGFVEFGAEITGNDQSTRTLLTSQDEIFESIRNRHFSTVFEYLSSKIKELQSGYDKRHTLTSVGALKKFVSNDLKDLKNRHKTLQYHIGACEVVMKKKTKGDFEEYLKTEHNILEGIDFRENMNYIEECINRQLTMVHSLRLLCLLSLTSDGIASKDFKSIKTQFLQSHGFEHMLTLHNLQKLGLLTEQELLQGAKPLGKVAAGMAAMAKRSTYQAICKKLNLVPKAAEDINLKSPRDMSYTFSGAYTPLSCRLIEEILNRDGFSGLEDLTKLLPGETFNNVRSRASKVRGGNAMDEPSSRVVLVYFLGGCTFSEIAALRLLGKEKGYRFMIATTAIINGSRLIETFMEK